MAFVPYISVGRWLLAVVLAAGIYFFHGFIVPVLAALVIAFASWPLYQNLLRRVDGNRTLGATIALLLVLAFLIVPLVAAFLFTIEEARVLIHWIIEANRVGAAVPEWIPNLPVIGAWLAQQWENFLGRPGALAELGQVFSGANLGGIYRAVVATGAGLFDLFLKLLFMLIALFFIYRDGQSFAAQVDRAGERVFPTRWARLSRIVPATVSSTVVGMTLIAIGEGIVLGLAYWIAGAPSPITLGAITGVMALIPGGAPLSFTLVSIYLVASGSPTAGIGLFLWGSIELFIVDKTLRPRLVGGPIKLPFLPTFFGLVGGVKTMGFIGLFIGPVLMALLVAIWREWLREIDEPIVAVVELEAQSSPSPPPPSSPLPAPPPAPPERQAASGSGK